MEKAKDAKGFLIDGYPREIEQGKEFEKTVGYVVLQIKIAVKF